MKILIVSHSVLPAKGGSSIIIENLAHNFSKDEMVVLGSKSLKNPLVVRSESKAKFYYFFSELSIFGRGARFFNWFRQLRMASLIKYIEHIIKKEAINYVIGVYPNSFYCLAACRAAKLSGLPFSSYFHNTYIENSEIKNPEAVSIQDEIFQASEKIFVMSKGMESYYSAKYKMDNFVPLLHTYNEDLMHLNKNIPGVDKVHYKLVAIGNFNESNLDATRSFVEAIKGDDRFSLSIYTGVPKLLLSQRGIDGKNVIYKGYISPDQVVSALAEYDICVLTHGFQGGYGRVEYETIFPTRTIPFLLSGKPIFALSPSFSFLNDFIKENQCAELVEVKDEKAILAGLERIIHSKNKQSKLVAASSKTKIMFYGPNVAAELKKQLA